MGVYIHTYGQDGYTALMRVSSMNMVNLVQASWCGHLDIINYLHDAGADVNIPDRVWVYVYTYDQDGSTALIKVSSMYLVNLVQASEEGHLDIVKYLHDAGADVHILNKVWIYVYTHDQNGSTALIKVSSMYMVNLVQASYRGHLDIVKYLHDAGADVNIPDWVWVYIYTYDQLGITALIWVSSICVVNLEQASIYGHLDIVKYLHDAGADVNIPDRVWVYVNTYDQDGRTALIWVSSICVVNLVQASWCGHLDIVNYLHDAGADVNIQDRVWVYIYTYDQDGETALIKVSSMYLVNLVQASMCDYLDVVDYLLSVGVDRECRNSDGMSAYDVAATDEIKQVLMNYEKRLCVIVCDELGKRYNTNVFIALKIEEYL